MDPNDPEAQEIMIGESNTEFTRAVAAKVDELMGTTARPT
jgi:hypothetical protein